MTYIDMKAAAFAIKIANCKKCAKARISACRVGQLDFWKILDVKVHFPFTPYPAGTYIDPE